MVYTLCIESDSGRINITDETIIKGIDIAVFQEDKSSSDRSDQLYNTLVVEGTLTDKSQKETKEIFDWSMKTDKDSVYKTVEIKVFNQEELLRDYYLKDMYCSSYEEHFNEKADPAKNESIGTFVLRMKQRKGSIKTIKVDYE